jgi:hypothetical protein
VIEQVHDVLAAEQALSEGMFEGCTHALATVTLEQLVQVLDIARPQPRAPVDELGKVVERGAAQLEQMLALQIAYAKRVQF